jgi:hypothetical protein
LQQFCLGLCLVWAGFWRYSFFWYCALRVSTGLSKLGSPSDRRFADFQCACAKWGGLKCCCPESVLWSTPKVLLGRCKVRGIGHECLARQTCKVSHEEEKSEA